MTEFTTVKIPTELIQWALKETSWCGWFSTAEMIRNALRYYVENFSKKPVKPKSKGSV